MVYPFFRPLLFALDPETAHDLSLAGLDAAASLGIAQLVAPRLPPSPVEAMGLSFPNRIGVAAGLDKDAAHIDGLATLGFGFIECGTVTPRTQPGNPKPRLFRLPEAEALINRLGFNNGGIDQFVANVRRARFGPRSGGILGLNIGKNFDTPNERAFYDYLTCLRAVHGYASYVTVNISSPNTQGLRELQDERALDVLLAALKAEQMKLADLHGKYTPLVVKIAPDLEVEEIRRIARTLVARRIDGVVATNTTVDHAAVAGRPYADEDGGLSGRPLKDKSTAVIRTLAAALDGALPIIGVGGILSGADAKEKIEAGATLVQIYTGLIYKGPELVAEIARALA
ncbi:MAG: quinone-dependent dihydroorotate dehydrogenase [Betaproteobacteria bacterium]|nr:MAG: quinone-dependent dihydroorotate dehydrogenase [Betaproteobacteria bacterium]